MSEQAQRLKVLMLTTSMKTGGAPRFVSTMLDHLDRRVFAPELALISDLEIEYEIPQDVPVHLLPDEPLTEPTAALEWPLAALEEVPGDVVWLEKVVNQIASVVRRTRPDVVFSSPEWASTVAVAAKHLFPDSARLVCRVDGSPSIAFPTTGPRRLHSILVKRYMNDADRVAAVSSALAADLSDDFGVDPSRIVVMRNVVDVTNSRLMGAEAVTEVPFGDGVPCVVFVGRIERVKGLGYLLRAMADVIATTPARCVLVGEGSQAGYLRALSKHLGIQDHVHFVGTQNNPFRFMSKATVFVLPSLSEGLPTVLVEAMACGVPVIATDIEGGVTRELLQEGSCGMIVPREDSGALADAILRMLRDESLREEFTRRGREQADEFDLPKVMLENERLLVAVAGDRGSDQPLSPPQTPDSGVSRDVPEEERAPVCSYDASNGSGQDFSPDASIGGTEMSGPTRVSQAEPLPAVEATRLSASRDKRTLMSGLVTRLRTVTSRIGAQPALRDDSESSPDSQVLDAAPAKTEVVVLVPHLDDESMGVATDVLLGQLDRARYHVTLARLFAHGRDSGVPDDVEQLLIQTDRGSMAIADGDLPGGITDTYGVELEWVGALARGLGELAERVCADVVLAQGFFASVVATMARGCLPPNTATIAGIHNHAEDFYGPWSCSEMYGAMIRAYLDRADVVWAPDETIQKDLVDKLGVTADKAIVIRNPIVVDGDAASADREYTHEWLEQGIPAVLCFEERESPESMTCLFEALSLARQQEDVRCLVLGNRDRRASLAEAAARLGIERSVEFVDEPRNPRPYFRKSLAYVHPAVAWEGSAPTALSRAVADGCAVISSKSANATRDLIGASERGLLVPMKDAEALAEAMLQLVWDGEFRQKLVARARAYLDSVSPRSTVRRFDEVIADCVRERRAAAAVSARASSPESDVST